MTQTSRFHRKHPRLIARQKVKLRRPWHAKYSLHLIQGRKGTRINQRMEALMIQMKMAKNIVTLLRLTSLKGMMN